MQHPCWILFFTNQPKRTNWFWSLQELLHQWTTKWHLFRKSTIWGKINNNWNSKFHGLTFPTRTKRTERASVTRQKLKNLVLKFSFSIQIRNRRTRYVIFLAVLQIHIKGKKNIINNLLTDYKWTSILSRCGRKATFFCDKCWKAEVVRSGNLLGRLKSIWHNNT